MKYIDADRAWLKSWCRIFHVPDECAEMLVYLTMIIARSSTAKAENFSFIAVRILREESGSVLQVIQKLSEIAANPAEAHQFLQDWQNGFPKSA